MMACLGTICRSGFLSTALLLLLLLPSRPMPEAKARRLHETSRVYAMLKSSQMELTEPSARALAETIWQESKRHALDPLLVLAVIRVESEFRPEAVSPNGARGLMQLSPAVAHALALETELKKWDGEKSLDDPFINIKLGVFYLGFLKEKFGDLKVALTAYNYGPTWVEDQIEAKTALPLEYARKVLSVSRHYRQHGNI